MGRYELDAGTVMRFNKEIEQREPVTTSVRDVEDMSWKRAQVIISNSPLEGGDAVAVWGAGGSQYRPGEFYMKILHLEDL